MATFIDLYENAFIEIAKSLSEDESFILKCQNLEGKKKELFEHILSSPNLFEKEKETVSIFLILSFIIQSQDKDSQANLISKIFQSLSKVQDKKETKLKM